MPNSRTAPLNVAIVDDSPVMRALLAEALAEIPRVRLCGEGRTVEEGLRLLNSLSPDVLILDIELPPHSGIDLLRMAKQSRVAPIVIMLSNHDLPAFRARCADLGAEHYFHKLTEFTRVAEVCRDLVDGLPG